LVFFNLSDCVIQRFNTTNNRDWHWTRWRFNCIYFPSSQLISLRSILMLYSHFLPALQFGRFSIKITLYFIFTDPSCMSSPS
jgi:hypothetical protein